MAPIIPKIPAIGVTGSAGKSTTTALIYYIFRTKWKHVLKTPGTKNLPKHTKENSEKIKPYHKAVILEMAAGHKHFRYIKPNFGVITNIGTAHYGRLGNSIKKTVRAKSGMIKYMNPNGTLLLNEDDKNSKLLSTKSFKGKLLTIGIKNRADYQTENLQYSKQGMTFNVRLNGKLESFFLPTFGEHNVINALFAIAIAHQLRFSPREIRTGLKKFKPRRRRLNVTSLPNRSLLLDDTFNANPQAVKAATDVLVKLGEDKKKIAVIGSMLELGKYSKRGHQEVGKYLAGKNMYRIFVYGKQAKEIKRGAINHGYPPENIFAYTSRKQLHKKLKSYLSSDTVFLIKGSSQMKMKETARFIKKYGLKAKKR
ncbi:UDP-N-acetylmuramoyl-tripeptide--D-alanyl-D-alanine ligase [Alteribacillus sp. JSM 102045]|uniref:UDP-N-acetylmuramoyl-tripeptide--D-alanyl-D- alanine ligase n=1 Tax=Alteribacillus sp. JSM 102045 TaxID=1562101 RepID=UPI0035C020CB